MRDNLATRPSATGVSPSTIRLFCPALMLRELRIAHVLGLRPESESSDACCGITHTLLRHAFQSDLVKTVRIMFGKRDSQPFMKSHGR